MIIKGSSRGQSAADTKRLALHLLAAENERVDVVEIRGVVAAMLGPALEEMRLVTLGSRARRGLYHASINLDRREALETNEGRWLAAADELETRLGLGGHARVIVQHVKAGRKHIHIVWCRVNPRTLRLTRDSQNYCKHEQCARFLETQWKLGQIVGVHTRQSGTPRPVARATHEDWQAEERTGIKVDDVATALKEAWNGTSNSKAFAEAIYRNGLRLAHGRRGIVVVDAKGTPHSLPRRLQLRAAEVEQRLGDINTSTLPTVDQLQSSINKRKGTSMNATTLPTTAFEMSQGGSRRVRNTPTHPAFTPEYWRQLGCEPEEIEGALLIRLPNGTRVHDRGDSLSICRIGEPTDDEIRIMVAAGKARGWESVRFFGGSPAFQQRARLEALRQGYRLDQISLECEDGAVKPASMAPMPQHIRRLLTPRNEREAEAPTQQGAGAPVPVPEARP